jgi:hypothetical protein
LGSLKHNGLLKVGHPTGVDMHNDVAAYMKYYNVDSLHSANDDLSPVNYESSSIKVSIFT